MTKHGAILGKYLKVLYPQEKPDFLPLKDQAQITFILDTLSRKNHHHLIVFGSLSEKFNFSLLTTVAQHFTEEHLPKLLRDACFLHLDITRMLASQANLEQIEIEFKQFIQEINHQPIILAVNQLDPFLNPETHTALGRLATLLTPLLTEEKWRLLVMTTQPPQLLQHHPQLNYFFTHLKLHEPTISDNINLLKHLRDELEKFHQVVIPDETLLYALSMANNYLGGTQAPIEKALQLLDSGAARATTLEQHELSEHKPILTNSALAHLVASWTRIPLTHLQPTKFKAFDFMQGIQKTIFGQDAAIHLISLALQYARIKLHPKTGPLCSFLFAGPPNVGKSETASAMAEQLFGQRNTLLRIHLDKNSHPSSLAEIKVTTHNEDNVYLSLLDAIQQTPYAIILLENIHLAPHGTLDLFYDLLMHGITLDEKGHKYDFRHAIVIITTTLGSERIIRLTQPTTNETAQAVDLMQLVLNEPVQDTAAPQQTHLSPQELCEEMMPALETYFSTKLLRQLTIIPFGLLDYAGIEKIMRLKLKLLAKQLDSHYGIELQYAPEVLRFLVQETLWRGAARSIDKILEQHLYACVAHELLTHAEEKSRAKHLQLQLNDAGQLLRCEFIQAAEANLYQL